MNRRLAGVLRRVLGSRVLGCGAAVFALLAATAAHGGGTTSYTTAGSGNYTVPGGVTTILVEMWGGGGGGGGVSSAAANAGAGGGGGGAYTATTLSVTPGATPAYTVGAGGTQGANTGGNGGTGGSSTFAGATTAVGGSGGVGVTTSNTGGAGGNGGAGTHNGGKGGDGTTTVSGAGGASGGSATDSGDAVNNTRGAVGIAGGALGALGKNGTGAAGAAGSTGGGGGSGALNLGTPAALKGGSGGVGKIIVSYWTTYYSQGSGDATQLGSWNTVRGGGGSAPANFTSGDIFVIQNGHNMTMSGAWTFGGTGAEKLQIESGGKLTADYLISTLLNFQVDDGGTYVHNAVGSVAAGAQTDFPGTARFFGANSTVEFQKWANGGSAPIAFTAITGINSSWGNLTINVASLGGNWVQSADITVNGNFVVQATGGTTRELQLNNTTSARAVTVGGNLSVSGGILNLSTSTGITTVNVSGDVSASGGTLKATTATYGKINFAKSGTQNFTSGGTVNNIDWAVNSGATVAAGTSVFSGSGVTFTLNSGGGFSTTSASGINGNFSGITPTLSTGGTYTFAGSAGSAVTGSQLPTTVNSLTIDNANGVTLSGNTLVNSALTLTSGQLIPGANTFTLGSAATVSGASGSSYVRGSLVRTFTSGSGQSFTAPVGTSTKYRPAAISALDVGTGGTLTFNTTDGDHADIANSGIMNSKSANCVWTVTPGGLFAPGAGGYSLDLTWASGDLDGTANANNFVMKKYNGATWSSPASVTASATHTLGTGFAAFSDFIVGESGVSPSSPTVGNDSAVTTVGAPVAINVTTNDTNFTAPIYQVLSNQLWIGSGVQIQNTNLLYTPAAGSNGVDTFQYVITNASGSATGTVTVTVNIPPLTAGNDGASTLAGSPITIHVTTNDTNFVAPIGSVLSNLLWAGSTVSIANSTNLVYTPAPGSNGVDQFQYVITNAFSQSATATVSVTVSPPAVPTVGNDSAVTYVATPVAISVTTNDANFSPPICEVLSNLLWGGSSVQIQNTNLLYTPAAGSNGVDQFQYVVTNASGSATGTVTVTVNIPPPSASNDTAATIVNGSITIPVTTNDANFVAPIASVTPLTWPGSAVSVTNGTNVYYSPAVNSNGTDSFRYVITNAFGQSATGTVTVTVSVPTSHTWDGGGGDDKWSTGANWDYDAAPVFPVALTFAGSTRLTPSNDYVSVTNNSITFDPSAGAFTLGGNAITLGGSITQRSVNAQSINLGMTLGTTATVYFAASGSLELGGAMGGAGGLTFDGSVTPGAATLSSTNSSFGGRVTVGRHIPLTVYSLANQGQCSSLGTGSGDPVIQLGNSSVNGTLIYSNSIDASTDRQIQIGSSVNSGTATIQNSGAGRLTFTANPFNAAAGNATAKTLTLLGGGSLSPTNEITGNITNNNTGSISVTIGSSGAAGTWRLSWANTYTGITTIVGGSVLEVSQVANGGATSSLGLSPNAAANLVFSSSGGTLRYVGAPDVVTDRGFTTPGGNSATVIIESSGAGTFSFDNTVAIAHGGNANQTKTLVLGGTNTGTNTFGKAIANNGAGAVSVNKTGTGTWILTAINTYSGATTISGGLLKVNGQTGADSGTGTGAVNVNAGGALGGNGRVAGAITVANTNTASLYPANAFAGGVLTCGSNLTFSGSNAVAKFDLSASTNSGNDRAVLEDKILNCNGAHVTINSTGALAAADYTLLDVGASGTINGNFAVRPLWTGTAPANSNQYTVTKDTRYVYLHYLAPPTAGDDSAATYANVAVTIPVTTNDANVSPPVSQVLSNLLWNGSSVQIQNTNLFYTPAAGSNGVDQFQYVVTNALGQSATGTVTVTVNVAPLMAGNDSAATTLGQAITINATTNDLNFIPPISQVMSNLLWAGSTVTITDGTNLYYTPAAGSNGTDQFQYVITNATEAATGTVTVTVSVPPLIAGNDAASTIVNAAVVIPVTTNDLNFAAPIASVTPLTWPGSSVLIAGGTNVYYTPAANSNGTDSFRYVITNAYGQSATGTVTVTVTMPTSRTWDGGGADDKWSTGANWDYDAAPAFPVAVTFDGSTRLTPSNDSSSVTVNGITFGATAGAFTIGGNAIALNGNIGSTAPTDAAGARTQTINVNMDIGASTRTITAAGNSTHYHNITLAGVISGAGGLTKVLVGGANNAVVSLSGTNTFAGKMSTAGSPLSINSIANSGVACAIGKGSLINLSGTLTYTGGSAGTDRQIEVAGNSTLRNDGGALTFANPTFNVPVGSNTYTLTLGGAGTGTNEIQGVIQNQGSPGLINVTLGSSSLPGNTWRLAGTNTCSGIVTLSYGGILEATTLANGGGNCSLGASDNAASNLVFGASGGTLRYVGSAHAATDRAITYCNSATIPGVIESSGAGTVTIDTSAAANGFANATANACLGLGGSNTGTNTYGKNLGNNPATSGTLAVQKLGSGRWILAGNNTYSGDTTLYGGVLEVDLGGSGLPAASKLVMNGGVLQASGALTRSNSTGIAWTLAGGNGGGFSARGGKLTVTIGNDAATEQICVSSGGGNNLIAAPLLFGSASASAEIEFQNKINLLNAAGTTNRVIDVAAGAGGDFATLSGVIRNSAGTAGIVKTGAGTLKLTATNTYNGGTIVSGGTLLVNNGSGSGTGGGAVSVDNGTLGGTGRVAGAITIADTNTAVLYPHGNFAGATLTCGSNVTFAGSNAVAKFDLSASAGSGNDKVVLENKTLTIVGAPRVVINSAGVLDAADYVLFDVGAGGSISGRFDLSPVWAGTPPAVNAWVVQVKGTTVVLHAPAGTVFTFR